MKQIIEHSGNTDIGIDLYTIDGTRKGRHLTTESIAYIKRTMREGPADLIAEDGTELRIVYIERSTDHGVAQWTHHVQLPNFAARALGAKGGAAKSEAKSAAVRKNGAKGGRPKS